jgi:hypothetical protein
MTRVCHHRTPVPLKSAPASNDRSAMSKLQRATHTVAGSDRAFSRTAAHHVCQSKSPSSWRLRTTW